MGLSYGRVNLMYSMLCSEHWRIKGSRSNKRRKLLACVANSLFKVYTNLSCRETGPKVYNSMAVSHGYRNHFRHFRMKYIYLTRILLQPGFLNKKAVGLMAQLMKLCKQHLSCLRRCFCFSS